MWSREWKATYWSAEKYMKQQLLPAHAVTVNALEDQFLHSLTCQSSRDFTWRLSQKCRLEVQSKCCSHLCSYDTPLEGLWKILGPL